jgi:hypothetical protein
MIGHLLGYHLTQVFLYISRLYPSFTPWVGRYAWWLANVETAVVDEGYKVLNFDCLVGLHMNSRARADDPVPSIRAGMGY